MMRPTILPRRYAPAKSVKSFPLTLSFCYIVAGWTSCATCMASAAAARIANNDAQPGASAAAITTATTTMHSMTALHTASVAATC